MQKSEKARFFKKMEGDNFIEAIKEDIQQGDIIKTNQAGSATDEGGKTVTWTTEAIWQVVARPFLDKGEINVPVKLLSS